MIVVDTSVFIDMYRQIDNSRTHKLKALAVSEDVILLDVVMLEILLDVVMLEILQGARDDLHSRRLQEHLRGFRPERAMTFALAVSGAMYSRKLRSAGVTIPKTMDLVIGTWCIENDCALLHNDRDFLPMVENLGLKEF